MTAAELISNHIPTLQTTDTVRQALDWMRENRITELPVVNDQKYVGLVYEDEIEDEDEKAGVATFLHNGTPININPADFFLVPLKIMHQQKLSLLPVVKDDGELMGIITREDLLQAASHYNAAAVPGGIIIIQMQPNSFYISEIGRIVESNNAKIIHLNTWTDMSTGELMVAIKVNKNDIQDILSSFERYEYNVIQYFGENLSEEELRLNYDHLMNYLNI
ncbi:MAG TPA: CBS domain-containing protein [Lacibacter sp.]|jgi:CBS domain-containing protein|nr:CBS domain-containing protein [Lacibacter sp.]